MALSVLWRERPHYAPTSGARTQGARRGGRTARRAGEPARAAPCLRQSPSAQWGGLACGADAARPCRYFDDTDIYARAGGTTQKSCARSASAGRRVIPILLGTAEVAIDFARRGERVCPSIES